MTCCADDNHGRGERREDSPDWSSGPGRKVETVALKSLILDVPAVLYLSASGLGFDDKLPVMVVIEALNRVVPALHTVFTQ